MKKCLIEAPFTFDAGPPIITLKYAFYKRFLGCDRFKDLDGALYKYLNYNLEKYNYLLYLSGGMTFSYPFTAQLRFNTIPFEDLYSVELLLSILYEGNYNDELRRLTGEMGLDYETCAAGVADFIVFFKKAAEELKTYEQVYIICARPAAVFSSILLMHFLKLQNRNCEGILVGKHATTPQVKQLIEKLGLFSDIVNDDFLVKAELDEEDAYGHLEADDFELDFYPETMGMKNIAYSICNACPYKCYFCSISMNWDGRDIYRNSLSECKTLAQVKRDLQKVKETFGNSIVVFSDSTMNYVAKNPELFDILKQLNMLYTCTSRADIVTDDFCRGLIDSHFISVIVGVESLNQKAIELMGKGGSGYVNAAVKNCKKLYDTGIEVQLNSLICYPYESYEDVKESIACWKAFADDMRNSGIIVKKIPVGTLTLNYPSKMYFDVMNDDRFEKTFHNVTNSAIPEEIRAAAGKIPYYATDTQKEAYKTINKMDLVKQIYRLWDSDMNLLDSSIFGRFIQNSDVFVEAWNTGNNVFSVNCGKIDDKLYRNPDLAFLIQTLQSKEMTLSEIVDQMPAEREPDVQNVAQLLILLSYIGVVKISTGRE